MRVFRQKFLIGFVALSLVVLVSLAVSDVAAQSGRGTINGIVRDASGAVVPGVEVTATSKTSGEKRTVVTTDSGVYRIPYLEPGLYQISASLAGFKTAVADNVTLLVAQTLGVDLVLEIGEVAETITVSASGPLLETSTSEIGTNANAKEVAAWPIIVSDGTRQLQDFIFRAMPGTQGGSFAGTINGGQEYSHEILLDGITVGRMDLNGGNTAEFTPTMDAVSEFKLQTGALSSQYGGTQTALTNFGLKSGSNEFHGSAFWFHLNSALNANSWSNNRSNREKVPAHENNFGASVGGPIFKDKTHFFFNYEGERRENWTITALDNIPVSAFKRGDFSQLLDPAFTSDSRSGTVVGQDALGRDIIFGAIYDPATSRQLSDGTWIRDPFEGNIIPMDRISSLTKAHLTQGLADPKIDSLLRNDGRVSGCCPILNINNWSVKIDHLINTAHKLSGSFISNDRWRDRFGGSSYRGKAEFPGPGAAGFKRQATPGWIIRLAEDWTISPTVINHAAIGYNRFQNKNQSWGFINGIDWKSELGFVSDQPGTTFPVARFRGNSTTLSGGYRDWGDWSTSNSPNGSTVIVDDMSLLLNNHSLRFGIEHRWYYTNGQSSQTNGRFDFHNENTALPGYAFNTGFSFASYFLGTAQAASMGITRTNAGDRSRYLALYVQDDWKVRSNFTLNLGVRWDIPTPIHEVAGRMSSLDPNVPNPGADGFPGALVFREKFADTYYGQIGPRIGFAWALKDDIVIRGGYGINYSPPISDGWHAGYTAGFNGSNPIISRQGAFREEAAYSWDNPYPDYTLTLPNTDPTQNNGQGISWYLPYTNKFPYVQNWNFGIQFDAGWDTKIEANYIGNRGVRLMDSQYLDYLNQVNPMYLSLGDTLLDDINDHPEIAKPYPSFEGSVARALRPFPQYEGIGTARLNGGWSTYNSMQLTATKRSDYGLSFLASYTFSKSLGTADSTGPGTYYEYGQDFYNRKGDYAVTRLHSPHDLKLTWIYDLPFGPQGRYLNSGIGAAILGGWQISAIHRYQTGSPLQISVSGYASDALFNPGFRGDVLISGDGQKVDFGELDSVNGTQVLNPNAFAQPPATSNGVPERLGNAPRWLNTRGFARYNEDVSLIKRTDLGLREGMNFELRFDFINFLNRVNWSNPSTDLSDPASFGKVYGKGGGPRTIQAGIRINF